jgi:threonine/homoserine/homoserine lactone efflux protein
MSILPAPATYVAFCAAAVALILTPGPDTIYVLARGVGSRRAGVRSAFGIATGVLIHTAAATLGLAALLRTVPAAYRAVKYAGAVYLVYLGVQAIRNDAFDTGTSGGGSGVGAAATGSFRRGVLVNVLNPKVALFFLAFLPGFAGSGPDAPARMALLGATYAGLTAVYLGVVAVASGRVGRALSSATRVHWLGGGAMIVLGVALAVE